MKVCIAEKPSVAREIAEVLGATKEMNGYIEETVSGYLDIRTSVYTQGTSRIHRRLETMEPGSTSYDSSPFRYQVD